MTKSQDSIKRIKDYRVIDHAIVVKLAQVFDFGNPSLVELEVILLQSKYNRFHDVVDDSDDEILVVTVQSTGQDSK